MLQLAAALAFLTRIPIARRTVIDAKDVARSSRWFPLVGALLGGIYIAAMLLLGPYLPPFVVAVIIVGLEALLTGMMHLDGVADTADGFGGGLTRDDVLRIMRDHAIGSYGAGALIFVIALKLATIVGLVVGPLAVPALLLAPVLGRWSAVLLSATEDYVRPLDARPASPGSPSRWIGRRELIIATGLAAPVAVFAGHGRGVAAMAAAAAGTLLWGRWCRRRIGGVTGDTIGVGVEISECLTLLIFTANS